MFPFVSCVLRLYSSTCCVCCIVVCVLIWYPLLSSASRIEELYKYAYIYIYYYYYISNERNMNYSVRNAHRNKSSNSNPREFLGNYSYIFGLERFRALR